MKNRRAKLTLAACLFSIYPAWCESGAVVVNSGGAAWTRETGDPPGSQSVMLREDPQTGAQEMFARYPAGHVFRPHWHSVNERILLIEGRLSLRLGDRATYLEPGGFAFLPAKEVQKMACVSKTSCTFYLSWDGKPDFHPAPAE